MTKTQLRRNDLNDDEIGRLCGQLISEGDEILAKQDGKQLKPYAHSEILLRALRKAQVPPFSAETIMARMHEECEEADERWKRTTTFFSFVFLVVGALAAAAAIILFVVALCLGIFVPGGKFDAISALRLSGCAVACAGILIPLAVYLIPEDHGWKSVEYANYKGHIPPNVREKVEEIGRILPGATFYVQRLNRKFSSLMYVQYRTSRVFYIERW